MNLRSFFVVPAYTFFYWGFTLKKDTYPSFINYFKLGEGNLEIPITLEINRKKYSAKLRVARINNCLLYTSPSPRDAHESRMPSSA